MVGKDVQLSSELGLPIHVRQQLMDKSFLLLRKYEGLFDVARLRLHFKNEGSRLACTMNLFTNGGTYHAHASGWDALEVVHEAADRISLQLRRHNRRQASSFA